MVAFLVASVCSAQIDERCPSTARDRGPKLLSSLNSLKDTARNEGHQGRLLFRLTVTETGGVRDPVVTYPAQFTGSENIKGEILKLRFCPAVRYSRYTEVEIKFDIELK
jgi:hypothetical protein